MPKIKCTRTPESQMARQDEGRYIENFVRNELLRIFPLEFCIEIIDPGKEGIDLTIRNGITLRVEVKSINRWEREIYGGVERRRSGRFFIKNYDYVDSDFFAFVVKEVDGNYKWDRSKPLDIKYVKTCSVRKFLEIRGLLGKDNVKILISNVETMEPMDFRDLVDEKKRERIAECY